jgi:hypothetical protein
MLLIDDKIIFFGISGTWKVLKRNAMSNGDIYALLGKVMWIKKRDPVLGGVYAKEAVNKYAVLFQNALAQDLILYGDVQSFDKSQDFISDLIKQYEHFIIKVFTGAASCASIVSKKKMKAHILEVSARAAALDYKI